MRMQQGSRRAIMRACVTLVARGATVIVLLALVGCVLDGLPDRAACTAGAPYMGPSFAPSLAPSGFPVRSIDWTAQFSARERARLDRAWADGVARTDATVASVTVARLADGAGPPGAWSSQIGVDGPDAFWWGSVGKIVTAAVIMQLEAEGVLSLDDAVSRWFPDFPGADTLTVEHLLRHTGGVHSFDRDATLRGRQDYVPPERLIAASARQGLDFCPGTNWLYSNTGYVMLARIAERVDGMPFARIVARRIAEPLGMDSVRTLGPGTDSEGLVAPAGRPGGAIPAFATTGGAGPVAGNAGDMVRLLDAFMGGRLPGTDARDGAVSRLVPMFSSAASYGRGIMVIDVPGGGTPTGDAPARWVGHTGGSPDAKAVAIYDVARRTYVGLLLNTDADGERIALALLEALE